MGGKCTFFFFFLFFFGTFFFLEENLRNNALELVINPTKYRNERDSCVRIRRKMMKAFPRQRKN